MTRWRLKGQRACGKHDEDKDKRCHEKQGRDCSHRSTDLDSSPAGDLPPAPINVAQGTLTVVPNERPENLEHEEGQDTHHQDLSRLRVPDAKRLSSLGHTRFYRARSL